MILYGTLVLPRCIIKSGLILTTLSLQDVAPRRMMSGHGAQLAHRSAQVVISTMTWASFASVVGPRSSGLPGIQSERVSDALR